MKKLLFILPLLYYSCTSDKVDTDDTSKSDKLFKLIEDVAKDNLVKSKVDCRQRCEDTFDLLGWNRKSEGEGIDTLFNECVQGCSESSGNSPVSK